MKVIFCDIDGVLNSRMWDTKCRLTGGNLLHTDPKAVIRLLGAIQNVAVTTGATPKIVLSSTWRTDKTMQWPFPIHDITPRGDAFGKRADEIEAWLAAQPDREDIQFVILDDEPDAGVGFEERFVQTDVSVGLTAVDATRIIGLLT